MWNTIHTICTYTHQWRRRRRPFIFPVRMCFCSIFSSLVPYNPHPCRGATNDALVNFLVLLFQTVLEPKKRNPSRTQQRQIKKKTLFHCSIQYGCDVRLKCFFPSPHTNPVRQHTVSFRWLKKLTLRSGPW